MYLAINLTVVDMFVGGSATSVIVLLFLLYGCGAGSTVFIFIAAREWPPILLVFFMIDTWVSLTSLTGIAVISLDRMHATFRPFRHRNTEKWVYGVTIAGVWISSAMIFIPSPIIRLYGNLHQQWQLVFAFYLWLSYGLLCLFVIFVSYTSIALKFWCGTRPPSHGAANRQRKLTVTLFIMTIVSLLLFLPFPVYTLSTDRSFNLTFLRLRLSLLFYTTQTRLLIP